MINKTTYTEVSAYETRDGSEIRELMHPDQHAVRNQSLAEATIAAGATTRLHRHHNSEEIYYISCGQGVLSLNSEQISVAAGDSVCIPPGTPHCISNTGTEQLKILCCCAPPYSHEDTELLE